MTPAAFAIFFLVGSTLLLISALFVIRSRSERPRSFGIAMSVTAVLLLAGAVLRLTDPAAAISGARRLMDVLTVANLSATSVLLIGWTARRRKT